MRIHVLKTNPNAELVLAPAFGPSTYDNPVLIYLASLAPGSRRTMRQALAVVVSMVSPGAAPEAFPWSNLRFQHVTAIRCRLSESYSSSTANKILAAMKGVLRAAFSLGQMDSESYARSTSVKAIRGNRPVRGRAMAPDELNSLIDECNASNPAGARNGALIAVAYGTGLRRSELVQLTLADFDRNTACLRVRGKGNKVRLVPMNRETCEFLERWIAVRGEHAGPVFLSVNKTGVRGTRQLSEQAVYTIFRRLSTIAKVERFSPHDLRRTFVSNLLDAGVDLSTVQGLAGHASVTTTTRYDRRGESAKRRAVELLSFAAKSNRDAA